jgi:phenylacetate-CoA ligase
MYIPTLLRRKSSPAVTEKLRFLLESQYWPLEQLSAFQQEKLSTLLRHAFTTVPYYADMFRSCGATPDDIRSADDFARLPTLTKGAIQENFDRLTSTASDVSAHFLNATGGSTGTPLRFLQDAGYSAWAGAARIRAWKHMVGGSVDSVEAVLWGAIRDIGKGLSAKKTLYHLLREGSLPLNTFDLDDKMLRKYLTYYNLVRPDIVRGYATSLYYVAQFVRDHQLRLHSPRAVVSSAEVLYPHMRTAITEVFGADVYDSYGCREVSQIATECEAHHGLHIVTENQYVELVDQRIIVTNLNNYAMPFLRYEVGDLAEAIDHSPCRCGRTSPRLVNILGRDNENIQLPCGKVINGEFFEFLFFEGQSVRRFQVIYHRKRELLTVRLQLAGSDKRIESVLRDKMRTSFGFENVAFEYSDEFSHTPTGKLKFVYSVDD